MEERNLFTLDPELKGWNKRIFWEVVNELPDGAILKITPFTQELRRRGATLSEESCSRYMRFARLKWGWGVNFKALGKGRYRVEKMEFKKMVNKIILGSALPILKTLPDKSIDMVITSPPYWGLRNYGTTPEIWDGDENCEHIWVVNKPEKLVRKENYGDWDRPSRREYNKTSSEFRCIVCGNEFKGKIGQKFCSIKCLNTLSNEQRQNLPPQQNFCQLCGAWKGELGLEPTFELYIDHLIQIFSEVKRVLKDEGTCWVNIGDSYASSGGATRHFGYTDPKYPNGRNGTFEEPSACPQSVLPKSLCGIPERFALAMTDRLGFIRRNTIIWYKKNCMPSSARDRFTVDFEYLYFFSKQGKYYFEQQFEPLNWDTLRRSKARHSGPKAEQLAPAGFSNEASIRYAERLCSGEIPQARNKRCVWEINTIPFKEAHYAVFPEELVRTPILAGCPEFICSECGKAREKMYEARDGIKCKNFGDTKAGKTQTGGKETSTLNAQPSKQVFIGYTDCGCNAGYHSGIVLDPFMGSGTTALVALKLNRQFIGIEINPSYVEMAKKRIRQEQEKQRLFST